MFEFRAATNADSPAIRQLIFAVLKEFDLEPDPTGIDQDLFDIESSYFANRGYFYVVEDQHTSSNKIIATTGIHRMTGGLCELRKMYLATAYRGQGIGKKLLDSALAKARSLGYKKMQLETASCLKQATALYLSYGFKPIAAVHLARRCDAAFELDLLETK